MPENYGYIREAGQAPVVTAGRTPWRRILRSRSIWFLALSYGVAGFPSYVFYTWFFLYLANVRKVGSDFERLLVRASLRCDRVVDARRGTAIRPTHVALRQAVGQVVGGMDREFAGNGPHRRRRAHPAPEAAIVCLALAAGFHLFSQPPSWAATIDLAPAHSATVFGIMNTLAQGIGAAAPVLAPWIAQRFGWVRALDVTAAMALLAGCLWSFVSAGAAG